MSPESQAPASLPSEPKSIGLSVPTLTELYSTYPDVSLNDKLEAERSASVRDVAKISPALMAAHCI